MNNESRTLFTRTRFGLGLETGVQQGSCPGHRVQAAAWWADSNGVQKASSEYVVLIPDSCMYNTDGQIMHPCLQRRSPLDRSEPYA
jgi:hypothetical protein